MDRLTDELIRDEGLKLRPYRCTAGKLTIGCGRNLDDNGLTEAEARYLLANDIATVSRELDRVCPWWGEMGPARQRALANMAFNLGVPRLRQFRMMLAALDSGDWEAAASEALDSQWAKQVGARAQRIAEMFRNGGE
jgi:lysozyme